MLLYDVLVAPFADFTFMRRALVGACALAIGSSPLGVFLMLRRMSLTGDAMGHAILPGAAVGYILAGLSLPAMALGGLVAGIAVAFLTGFVSRVSDLREDASLAVFYLLSLALGVVLVSAKGSNIDLLHVLFGTALALDNAALFLIVGIASVTLVGLAVIFRPLVAECVDPVFLRSVSRAGAPTHFVFLLLVVLNLVAGFQALGTLLAVGVMMIPAATARLWTQDLTAMVLLAALTGVLSGYCGLLLSYHFGTPTGPAIILTAGLFYGVSFLVVMAAKLRRRFGLVRHLEA